MSVIEDIKRARGCGVVHVGVSALHKPALADLAREFGLASDPSRFQEIERAVAVRVMQSILHRDLAYCAEVMSMDSAVSLSERLLSEIELPGARYYSNGVQDRQINGRGSYTFQPMTDATFDGGVLILGVERSGCLWVEDED